jgi:hypothetical protein
VELKEGRLFRAMSVAIRMAGLITAILLVASCSASAQDAPGFESTGIVTDERATTFVAPAEVPSGDEIIAQLLLHNQVRDAQMKHYSVVRTYEVRNHEGKLSAQEVVRMDYRAPGTKTFEKASEKGSGKVRHMVFDRLMESESEAAAGREHHDSALTPANYTFARIGEEDLGPYHCYVVRATPKRQDKYLFEGNIWIHTQDFAVVRIAGHPAKKPSFWINRADFMRQYQKVGEFWLPYKDETVVQVRLFGKKFFTIDHQDYSVEGAPAVQQQEIGSDRSIALAYDGNAGPQ